MRNVKDIGVGEKMGVKTKVMGFSLDSHGRGSGPLAGCCALRYLFISMRLLQCFFFCVCFFTVTPVCNLRGGNVAPRAASVSACKLVRQEQFL
jgi:hypothetical protein